MSLWFVCKGEGIKMKMITVGEECKNCIHSIIDESDKSMIFVECNARNKTYLWGQRVPCEDKKVK